MFKLKTPAYRLFTWQFFGLAALFSIFILVTACKRCQTCKVKDAVGNTVYYSDEYCTELEKHKNQLKEEWVCYNYTVNDSDGITVYISPQVCGYIDVLNHIRDSLHQVFIADSPSVIITTLPTRVECANHGE